jgi:hypothetical protein
MGKVEITFLSFCFFCGGLVSCSCSESTTGGDADIDVADVVHDDEGETDPAPDVEAGPEAEGPRDLVEDDAGEEAADAGDAEADAPPVSPYHEVRGAIHMHSVYSHDACDGHGLPGGVPDAECLVQLRAALCLTRMDFVALSDHPANMQDYSMEEDLLYVPSAGDRLVMEGGEPVANVVTCSDGHEVLYTVGYEHSHSMPLGLHHLLSPPDLYQGVDDSTPIDLVGRIRDAFAEAGAVHSVVHSEGSDISPPRIIEAGFQAMEWTNLHAVFQAVLGGDQITGNPTDVFNTVMRLEDFLLGRTGGPHADLVLLDFLPMMPPEGFDKWNEVQKVEPITGIIGTDAHRNVSIDPVCTGSLETYCRILAALFPNTLTLLLTGGSIVLSDGDRVDSYPRMLRWVENRVFVTELSIDGLADALRSGRSYGLFSVFGDPQGFVFEGRQGSTYVSMGEVVSGEVMLKVQAPLRPAWMGGAPFTATEAATAMVRVVLKRVDAVGTSTVVELDDLGGSYEGTVGAAGAYYVEVWIRPFHLATALADHYDLAAREYLWLITNPIRVEL